MLIYSFSISFADREVSLGHVPSNKLKSAKTPPVTWEPYFCVLLQHEQTFTAYRSEEMAVTIIFFLFFFPFLSFFLGSITHSNTFSLLMTIISCCSTHVVSIRPDRGCCGIMFLVTDDRRCLISWLSRAIGGRSVPGTQSCHRSLEGSAEATTLPPPSVPWGMLWNVLESVLRGSRVDFPPAYSEPPRCRPFHYAESNRWD